MSLYTIGGVRCDLAPFNVHAARSQASQSFAQHNILGSRPGHEPMREAEETLSLQGRIFPRAIGGEAELELLLSLMRAKSAVMVHRGGRVLGFHRVTSLNQRHTSLDRSGRGNQIELDISLARTRPPAAVQAATDFVRLFYV